MTRSPRTSKMSGPRSLFSLIAIAALLFGLVGVGPRAARAGQDDDAPSFEEIASETITVDDELADATWQATSLPTVSDQGATIPFAPGFLYATDGVVLVYRDGSDRSTRLRGGDALAVDGTTDIAPVTYGDLPTEFMAIELTTDDAADEPAGDPFSLPAGEWTLTLWSLDLPAGLPGSFSFDDATTEDGDAFEPDPALPTLVVATFGNVEVVPGNGAGFENRLSADGEAALTMTGDFHVTPSTPDDPDEATVLAVTITSADGSSSGEVSAVTVSPRGSARAGVGGGGGSSGGSRSGAPSPSRSASRSASPSASVDPATIDSDGDGLPDAAEASVGTDPNDADTDADGLSDPAELSSGTSPLLEDTDYDCVRDGTELARGTNPLNPITDPFSGADGARGCDVAGATTPVEPEPTDSDGDGLPDEVELQVGSDPDSADADNDGLTDPGELNAGTQFYVADTDGDCVNDFREVQNGTNPLNPITNPFQGSDGAFYGCG